MGGNALKSCTTRRYAAYEYYALEKHAIDILKSMFPKTHLAAISAYRLKESFGDMDIVVEPDNLPADWQEQVIDIFRLKPNMWFKNGNCFSFAYKQLQIDLIVTPATEYQTSLNYFAFNDLGNLVGRIAHSMGLKLGHDGLSYNWRIETYQFRNVILLTDWKDILPVLGLSWETYDEGFDNIEDIFEYVVSSPFFNRDIFLLHNRNHTSRVRDTKRKTYMDFLDWIEGYQETSQQVINSTIRNRPEGKAAWLPYLFEHIEGFKETYTAVQAEWDAAVALKAKWNGKLAMEWTGLSGKELGNFMQYLKEVQGERFAGIVRQGTEQELKSEVARCFSWWANRLPVV